LLEEAPEVEAPKAMPLPEDAEPAYHHKNKILLEQFATSPAWNPYKAREH
jgi:hypothetical protein